jgi:lysozyme
MEAGMIKKKIAAGAGLVALLGVAAANMSARMVAEYEGEVLTAYTDPVGIATVCYGDTDPAMAIPGATYSREECLRSLETQLIAHAKPVLECLDIDPVTHPHQAAAFVSLAYNIGASAFCRSTVARRWRAGDYAGACAAIPLWDKAGGKTLPGLVRRRAGERALCETDLPEAAP